MLPALILFAVMYICLLLFPKYRPWIAVGTAAVFLISGILPVGEIADSIDFNVLLMIGGTMGLVSLFISSGMPSLIADILLEKTPSIKWAMIVMALFAGVISAFMDNVATVLMIAPVAMEIAKKYEISPVPMVISIAVSSNLQGAATLVGDTTSILLGGYAGMDFLDFFVFQGKPGMFFVVEIGAVLSAGVLLILFRKHSQPTITRPRTVVHYKTPTVLLLLMIVLLIAASFIPGKPAVTNGLICVGMMVVGLILSALQEGSLFHVKEAIREIDYLSLLLLLGLFLVIGGIRHAGVIDLIASLFVRIGGGNLFLIYTIIVWASVAFSAFIDNIPYVATMLPVVQGISLSMGIEPYLLYFGLLAGATLGGNLTPIGASANITALGILRRDGYEVKTSEFMKIGVPMSLVAVVSGYVLIWLFWH